MNSNVTELTEKDLVDYIAAFKRRWKLMASIAAGIFFVTLLVTFLLPAIYRSTATILIEEQEIPTDLVRSTITTFAAQRLQTINQRVMTRANLERIITKFDLYTEDRKRKTSEEVIEQMRKDLAFEPISAEVIDPRTGQPSKATIAFSLSYDGHNPDLVQRVANEVTSLYLEENLKSRTQKTAETSGFLKEETNQMGLYVAQLEAKLADFKEGHMHSLPEQKDLNLQFMDRTERELMDIETQLRSLEERKTYLDGQLAQVDPQSPIASSTGERIMRPSDRLKALETQYLSIASQYSERHPDAVRMRKEIEALRKETGTPAGGSDGDQLRELTRLRTELATLTDKYSANHPDVVRLRKQVEALEKSIQRQSTAEAVAKVGASNPDNPAYITLQTQRDTVLQDIASLNRKRQELKVKLAGYEQRLSQTPDVERQYLELLRDYENSSARYRDLKAKEMEATIAEQLEKKNKGEHFSIIEPPLLPEKPVKPNRPAIGMLGFVLAVAAAVGYVLLMENLDQSIRGVKQVVMLTGQPPLAVIPFLPDEREPSAGRRRKWIIAGSSAAVLLLTLLMLHWLWRPLDVLWYVLLRKLGLSVS